MKQPVMLALATCALALASLCATTSASTLSDGSLDIIDASSTGRQLLDKGRKPEPEHKPRCMGYVRVPYSQHDEYAFPPTRWSCTKKASLRCYDCKLVPVKPGTGHPTAAPTTGTPTATCACTPTTAPAGVPTATPTGAPAGTPTTIPTGAPAGTPTTTPTGAPAGGGGDLPTDGPTATPTTAPAGGPTATPTTAPAGGPTATPTSAPAGGPTATPTGAPAGGPTATPTTAPAGGPTATPTGAPAGSGGDLPTGGPTATPTTAPAGGPTATPTAAPAGTGSPTAAPTAAPTAGQPQPSVCYTVKKKTTCCRVSRKQVKQYKKEDYKCDDYGRDKSLCCKPKPVCFNKKFGRYYRKCCYDHTKKQKRNRKYRCFRYSYKGYRGDYCYKI